MAFAASNECACLCRLMPRILLVEDAMRLAKSLARGLVEEGFEVDCVANGRDALERLETRAIDGIILDLGLPDMDGLDVIGRARQSRLAMPILVLTARDAVPARVGALSAGADDYLVKPFAFDELVARVRAL